MHRMLMSPCNSAPAGGAGDGLALDASAMPRAAACTPASVLGPKPAGVCQRHSGSGRPRV